MPMIGSQLEEIMGIVRAHANMAPDAGLGVSVREKMIAIINSTQESLYLDRDWNGKWAMHTKPLAAGQRYYDLPETLDYNFINAVRVRWAQTTYRKLIYGIGAEEYNQVDSEAGITRDYVQRYDYRALQDGNVQVEVWPIPSSNAQTLYFFGMTKLKRLVQEQDRSHLNGTLIALFAAGSMLGGMATPEGRAKLAEAKQYLSGMKKRDNISSGQIAGQMGGGPKHNGGGERNVRILVART